MAKDVTKFEEKLGIAFQDRTLLRQAFLHRSYLNEHREETLEHNERIEFLGDAVLELVSTEYLFAAYTDKAEGELTAIRSALVNTTMLARVANELEMGDYLLLSRGEEKDTGRARQYILANTFEAFVGALYLDQGYEEARNFISKHVLIYAEEIADKRLWLDAKSNFQERAQERAGVTPTYTILAEEGPDHDRKFQVGVFLGDEQVAEGEGRSKQEAEQDAARRALAVKKW